MGYDYEDLSVWECFQILCRRICLCFRRKPPLSKYAEELNAEIVKALSKRSPFLNLLSGGKFPEGVTDEKENYDR
jgi:hypothetical protein